MAIILQRLIQIKNGLGLIRFHLFVSLSFNRGDASQELLLLPGHHYLKGKNPRAKTTRFLEGEKGFKFGEKCQKKKEINIDKIEEKQKEHQNFENFLSEADFTLEWLKFVFEIAREGKGRWYGKAYPKAQTLFASS
jgi:hypothetical protein